MHMYHTQQLVAIGNQQRGDVALLHQIQRIDRQEVGTHPHAARRHDIGDLGFVQVDAHIEHPAQVAIGKDAGDFHQIVADHRQTQIFSGDFQQRVAQ